MTRELPFLRFWRSLNAERDAAGLFPLALGDAWAAYARHLSLRPPEYTAKQWVAGIGTPMVRM